MKKIFVILFILLSLPVVAQEDSTEVDSTVSVIAYFNKGEKYNYTISETRWKISGTGTVATASAITKATLTVADSTKNGYLMEWRYTDMQLDDSLKSFQQQLSQDIFAEVKERMVGQVIRFRISPEGEIKKWENMKDIERMAKDIHQITIEKVKGIPVVDSIKTTLGLDVTGMLKSVDKKNLAEQYTEQVELLFACHGKSYKLGDVTDHTPASDDNLEENLTLSVYWLEPENGLFCIDIENVTTYPKKDVSEFMGTLFGALGKSELLESDEAKEAMDNIGDLKVTSFYRAEMFDDGWPREVVDQTKSLIGGLGRVKQTTIYMTE